MALSKLTTELNKISTLETVIRDQAVTVKAAFDHDVNVVKDYINNTLVPEIEVKLETKDDIATKRKLSDTGNFTGTWNGHEMVETDPGIQIVVNEHTSQLAEITNDVDGETYLGVNTDTPIRIGSPYKVDGLLPRASIKGGLTVESDIGEITVRNTSDALTVPETNVLSLYHSSSHGSCATRFLRQSDGAEMGACGYQNGTGDFYLDKAVYLSASMPYESVGEPDTLQPAKLILGQEGYYNGVMQLRARFICDNDWSMKFYSPSYAVQMRLDADGSVLVGQPTTTEHSSGTRKFGVYGNVNGDMGVLVKNDAIGTTSAQLALEAGLTCGKVAVFPSDWDYGAYPAGGIALISNNDGGIALMALSTHQGITNSIKFLIGGDATANEKMRLNPAGYLGIGTTNPTSKLQVVGLPVYTTNALAVAGGLSAGAFYRTGADPDHVCVVH